VAPRPGVLGLRAPDGTKSRAPRFGREEFDASLTNGTEILVPR